MLSPFVPRLLCFDADVVSGASYKPGVPLKLFSYLRDMLPILNMTEHEDIHTLSLTGIIGRMIAARFRLTMTMIFGRKITAS